MGPVVYTVSNEAPGDSEARAHGTPLMRELQALMKERYGGGFACHCGEGGVLTFLQGTEVRVVR